MTIRHAQVAPVGRDILQLSLRDEDQTLFLEHNVTKLNGSLDIGKLQYAFETIVSRHDALRTAFRLDRQTGEIHAFIHDQCDPQFVVLCEDNETDALQKVQDSFKDPLPRDAPPLIRLKVVQVRGTETSYMIISACHAIMDGTSSQLFNRELSMLYNGEIPPSPAFQYSDFAALQQLERRFQETAPNFLSKSRVFLRNLSQSIRASFSRSARKVRKSEYTKSVKYYEKVLSKIPELMDYPCDEMRHARAPGKYPKAGCITIPLDKSAYDNLESFIAKKSLPQSAWWALTMTAVFMMLRVYSLVDDAYLMVPRTCRPKDMESVIGYFANEGIIRLNGRSKNVDGMTLSQIVIDLFVQLGQAAKHAQTILNEDIIKFIMARLGSEYHPQVTFTAIESEWLEISLEGIDSEPMEDLIGLAKAYEELYIRAFRDKGRINISMVYDTSLFEQGTATKMLAVAIECLSEWLQKPTKKLRDLDCYTYFSSRMFWKRLFSSSQSISGEKSHMAFASGRSDMGDTPCKLSKGSHAHNFEALQMHRIDKGRIDNLDILLSLIAIAVANLSYDEYSVVSCMSKASSGEHRLHLFNCQMDMRAENAAEMIVSVSKLREIAYRNAIFSYRQQIQVSTLSHGGILCVVPEETLGDQVLQTHQDILACLYLDRYNTMCLKYKPTGVCDENLEFFLKELDFICRSVSSQPEMPLEQVSVEMTPCAMDRLQSSINAQWH